MASKNISIILFLTGLLLFSGCTTIKDRLSSEGVEDIEIDFSTPENKLSSPIRIQGEDLTFDNSTKHVVIRFPQDKEIYCIWINADTYSMSPIIEDENKACLFKPRSPDDVQIGDIVDYTDVNGFGKKGSIMHRVISKDNGNFTLMGDNVPIKDHNKDTIPFKAIKGVVFAVIY